MTKSINRPRIERTERNADHEVIYPQNQLRARALLRVDGKSNSDDMLVSRAEKALEALSIQFDGWMNGEVDRLVKAFEIYADVPGDATRQVLLFRVAHDLKGHAAMLGYPLIGEAADSMARLLDIVPARSCPITLVERHVEAIRAIAVANIRGGDSPVALELVRELRERTGPVIEAYGRVQVETLPR